MAADPGFISLSLQSQGCARHCPVLATAPGRILAWGHRGTAAAPHPGSRSALTSCLICLWGALKVVSAVVNDDVQVSTGVARG